MPYLRITTRVFLVYFFTILMGTLVSACFLGGGSSVPSFTDLFFVGFLITGLCSLPNFIFLFFGIPLSYKKSFTKRELSRNLFLLATFICVIPFSCLVIIKALGLKWFIFSLISGMSWELLLMATPYILSCYFFLFMVNHLLDRRFPLEISKLNPEEDENLLDDGFINNNSV